MTHWNDRDGDAGKRTPENKKRWATIDHLRDKLHPDRRDGNPNREQRWVLSCWECNFNRGRESLMAVPIEKRREAAGRFPNPMQTEGQKLGRWPANIIHDGSDEVLAAFPIVGDSHPPDNAGSIRTNQIYGADLEPRTFHAGFPDSGSAARFFYTAKADSDDRLGSKHPTVKPVDLMQWLVRLVTPKGGLVLDPFAGTGTTAEACYREGMRCVLIEREAEYQADIRRRMALCTAGPDERARESIKAKTRDQPIDAGPLFANPAAAE